MRPTAALPPIFPGSETAGHPAAGDRHLSGMVNEDIGFEAAQVIEVEALAKEVFAQVLWRVEFEPLRRRNSSDLVLSPSALASLASWK